MSIIRIDIIVFASKLAATSKGRKPFENRCQSYLALSHTNFVAE
jgi:hypothetical protein